MSAQTQWDFRQILNVNPENDIRCVAINKGDGKRCGNAKVGHSNLADARVLLDVMDRIPSMSDCRKHLDKLAYLTMCGSPHRNMERAKENRVRLWNETIEKYMVSDAQKQREKAVVGKCEKAVDAGKRRGVNEAKFDNKGNGRKETKSSQPHKRTPEPAIAPVGRTVDAGTMTDRPFINSSKMPPKHQSSPEDPTGEVFDAPINEKTSEIFISKRGKEAEKFLDANPATQSYGLPSPPDSVLGSHISKAQPGARVQSPPETPTKAPALTNNTSLGLPSPEASDVPLKTAADGRSMLQFGNKERASTLQTFNFKFNDPTVGFNPSPDPNLKLNPAKSGIFAVKFGLKESTAKNFNFGLSANPTADAGNLPALSRSQGQEGPRPQFKFGTFGATETDSTLASDSSSTSKSPESITTGEHQSKVVERSPLALSRLPLLETVNETLRSDQSLELIKISEPPSSPNGPNQEPTVLPSSSSTPVNPILSLSSLKQKALPIFETTSFSKPQDSPPSSEVPVPDTSPGPKSPKLNFSSSQKHQKLQTSVDSPSMFRFGSTYKVPPTSFDFDNWSKVSLAARLPNELSTMWSNFTSEMEKKPDVRDDGVGAEEMNEQPSLKDAKEVENPMRESALGKTTESKDDLMTGDLKIESVEKLNTSLKLYTPPATRESSRKEHTIPSLLEHSDIATSGALKQPEASINRDLDETLEALEAATELLLKENQGNTNEIEGRSSEPPKTPTETHDGKDGSVTTPEATPQPSQIPTETTKITTELASEPALSKEDLVSKIKEEDNTPPEASLEAHKLDQDSHSIPEKDKSSFKPNLKLPEADQESLSDQDKDHIGLEMLQNRSELEEEIGSSNNKADDAPYQIIAESTKFPPTRAESFGYAIIDPSKRRYKTRFSERQQQALLPKSQIPDVSHISNDEDPFFEAKIIETLPNSSPGIRASKIARKELPAQQGNGEPGEGKKQLNWENDRGVPRRERGRRLDKEIWRHMRQGMTTVSETFVRVRRKSGRSSRSPVD